MRTTAIATLAAALLGLVGCSSEIAATPAPNPIDLCRKAGAEPDMDNATKGLKLDIGGWLGSCRFAEQASEGNASVGAFTQLSVYTYDNRKQLEEALSTNPNATTDDGHKVIVGNDQNFYAVVTGLADGTFDVKPEDVAASLNGSLRP
jgi:threonine dehydrogenase-like Zn-dependent dehydrogenase